MEMRQTADGRQNRLAGFLCFTMRIRIIPFAAEHETIPVILSDRRERRISRLNARRFFTSFRMTSPVEGRQGARAPDGLFFASKADFYSSEERIFFAQV